MNQEIRNILSKRIGPFPVGVWLVVIGGGIALGLGFRHFVTSRTGESGFDTTDPFGQPLADAPLLELEEGANIPFSEVGGDGSQSVGNLPVNVGASPNDPFAYGAPVEQDSPEFVESAGASPTIGAGGLNQIFLEPVTRAGENISDAGRNAKAVLPFMVDGGESAADRVLGNAGAIFGRTPEAVGRVAGGAASYLGGQAEVGGKLTRLAGQSGLAIQSGAGAAGAEASSAIGAVDSGAGAVAPVGKATGSKTAGVKSAVSKVVNKVARKASPAARRSQSAPRRRSSARPKAPASSGGTSRQFAV